MINEARCIIWTGVLDWSHGSGTLEGKFGVNKKKNAIPVVKEPVAVYVYSACVKNLEIFTRASQS